MTVKRPRARGWVHPSIVAEGRPRQQYEGLWSETLARPDRVVRLDFLSLIQDTQRRP
jgi:hypothetical protein